MSLHVHGLSLSYACHVQPMWHIKLSMRCALVGCSKCHARPMLVPLGPRHKWNLAMGVEILGCAAKVALRVHFFTNLVPALVVNRDNPSPLNGRYSDFGWVVRLEPDFHLRDKSLAILVGWLFLILTIPAE